MMINQRTSTIYELSVSDRAISGLLRGLLAGVFMMVVLVLAGILSGDSLLIALNRFNPFSQDLPLQGLLLHLGVSAVYGIVFGVLRVAIPRRVPGWLAGLLYGLLLFGLAELVILPSTGSTLTDLPAVFVLLAHELYGLILGL